MNIIHSKFEALIRIGRKLFFAAIFLAMALSLNAQSPGGVSVGLKTWLNANIGFTSGTPSIWLNQAAYSTPTIVSGSPNKDTTSTSYNYNYYINFIAPPGVYTSGSTDPNRQFIKLQGYDGIIGIDYSSLFWAANLTDLNRAYTHLATAEGISISYPTNGTLHGGGPTARLHNGDYDKNDFGSLSSLGTWQINASPVFCNAFHLNTKNLISAVSSGSGTTLNRFLGGQIDYDGFGGSPRDWRGPVAEIIAYTTKLTPIERKKVHCYLAIKYGVTLAVDYLATNAAIIYPASSSGTYVNNIIGIGRDDVEGLTQRQSHYNNDTVRLYIGSLATMNALNTVSFTNNISYVLMGDNNGQLNQTTASASMIPAGICRRIERQWKVVRTNNAQNFNIDIHPSTLINSGFFNTANLRLLVDTSSNMSNATICTPTFTINGGFITVSGITSTMIADNSTRYITIAIINDIVAEAGSDTTICQGQSINISASASGAGVSYSWSPATGLNNTTILQPTASPGNTTKYILTVSNGYCQKTDSILVTVRTPPVGVAEIKTICSNEYTNIQLTANITSLYTWTIGAITGSITGATSCSGPCSSVLNQQLNNISTTIGSVKYIVTPTSLSSGCIGIPFTITINVNPNPLTSNIYHN